MIVLASRVVRSEPDFAVRRGHLESSSGLHAGGQWPCGPVHISYGVERTQQLEAAENIWHTFRLQCWKAVAHVEMQMRAG
jgi:hypothetical protein